MGRWSGMTIRGKDSFRLSVVTAYRVCRGTISTAPLGSTYHREFTHLCDTGQIPPDPRAHFIQSLTTLIQELKTTVTRANA